MVEAHLEQVFSKLDARPDRLDLRDKIYRPPLIHLPAQYPSDEEAALFFGAYRKLVLDQGAEGACTGYGLAAVINYQFWFRDIADFELKQATMGKPDDQIREDLKLRTSPKWSSGRTVSPTMLYQMARLYDEWDGEDYSGSSCRGAMRGWHHHGVCRAETWPKNKKGVDFETNDASRYTWLNEAAERPLGAYYRIEKDALADMQAAIHEVHAIFAAARVHSGWKIWDQGKKTEDDQVAALPVIEWDGTGLYGGHAFAIVGYNRTGFIVQNSWGKRWGDGGFAVLTYADWLDNSYDAWACVYGAKSTDVRSPRTKSRGALLSSKNSKSAGKKRREQGETAPWSDYGTALHSVVLGKEGTAQTRMIQAADGLEQLLICAEKRVLRQYPGRDTDKEITLLIYAHSGLLSEEETLRRSAVMGPYFMANDIYPLFISWNTGLLEDLESLFRDAVTAKLQRDTGTQLKPSQMEKRIKETSGYTWEAIASSRSIRALWNERKDLSWRAGEPFSTWKPASDSKRAQSKVKKAMNKDGGMFILAEKLRNLRSAIKTLNVHLAGHSAGVFLVASLLKSMQRHHMKPETVTLSAPACSMPFAADTFLPKRGVDVISKDRIHLELCSREIEDGDRVAGLYQGSFLKLVSRALEVRHKTPLLGLASDWNTDHRLSEANARTTIWGKFRECVTSIGSGQTICADPNSDGDPSKVVSVKTSHCTLDQSIASLERLIARVRPDGKVKARVTDLRNN